jgi:hypothetical protein
MVIVDWSPFDRLGLGADVLLPASTSGGLRADITFRLHVEEHQRRVTQMSGAELRHEVITRLAVVPERWTSISELDLDALDDLAEQAPELLEVRRVDARGSEVRRVIAPPLTVEHYVVHARTWEQGVQRIDRFANYAARKLVVEREPDDVELAVLEASLYGFGLYVHDLSPENELCSAAPFMPDCFTVASWDVAERVYSAALDAGILGD